MKIFNLKSTYVNPGIPSKNPGLLVVVRSLATLIVRHSSPSRIVLFTPGYLQVFLVLYDFFFIILPLMCPYNVFYVRLGHVISLGFQNPGISEKWQLLGPEGSRLKRIYCNDNPLPPLSSPASLDM